MLNQALISKSGFKKFNSLYIGFWVIITLIFLYERRYLIEKASLGHFIECTIVRLCLLVSLAHLNMKYLLPRYFSARRYASYFMLLIISLFAYTSLQNLYDIYLYGYVIGDVDDRGFWNAFPYNFITIAWYLLLTVAIKLSLAWYRQRRDIALLRFELEKAETSINNGNEPASIFLKSGTKHIKADINRITHVKGLKDYSIIYMGGEKIIVKGSIKTIQVQFPEYLFIRVHKSYLVAKQKISTVKSNTIIIDGCIIPVGRSYKQELFAFLSRKAEKKS